MGEIYSYGCLLGIDIKYATYAQEDFASQVWNTGTANILLHKTQKTNIGRDRFVSSIFRNYVLVPVGDMIIR